MANPRVLIAFAAILAIVVVDQWTKAMVLNAPVFNAIACLDPMVRCGKIEISQSFDLTMLWNYGISFGTFQAMGAGRWFLFGIQLAIAIGFSVWLMKADRRLTIASLALVIGGAIGNMIDRARFGAVVDFFDFSGPWFGWQIPLPQWLAFLEYPFTSVATRDGVLGIGFPYVFNVADTAVTIGAILLFLDQFLLARDEQTTGKAV